MTNCIAPVLSMNVVVAAVLITMLIIGLVVMGIWLLQARDARRAYRELAEVEEYYRRREASND